MDRYVFFITSENAKNYLSFLATLACFSGQVRDGPSLDYPGLVRLQNVVRHAFGTDETSPPAYEI